MFRIRTYFNMEGTVYEKETKSTHSTRAPEILPGPSTAVILGNCTQENKKYVRKKEKKKKRRRERRLRRIRDTKACCKRFFAFLISNLGLSGLIVLYVIFGGIIFKAIEHQKEEEIKNDVRSFMNNFTNFNMSKIITDQICDFILTKAKDISIVNRTSINSSAFCSQVLRDTDFVNYIDKYLVHFVGRIVKYTTVDGWNGSFDKFNWNFAGAFLYVVTVITTIGYGHVVPKTTIGRIATILYASVGIPLVFLYLNNVGDYLADAFRLLYRDLLRPAWRKVFRRRTILAQKAIPLDWKKAMSFPLSHLDADFFHFPRNANSTSHSERIIFYEDGSVTDSSPMKTTMVESRTISLEGTPHAARVAYVMARVLPAKSPAKSLPERFYYPTENKTVSETVKEVDKEDITTQSMESRTPSETEDFVPVIDWTDIDNELHHRSEEEQFDILSSYIANANIGGQKSLSLSNLSLSIENTSSTDTPEASSKKEDKVVEPLVKVTESPMFADDPQVSTYSSDGQLHISVTPVDCEVTIDESEKVPMLRRCSYLSFGSQMPSTLSLHTAVAEDPVQEKALHQVTVPLSLSISVMVCYVVLGAVMFTIWEERDYIKWSYFCFITLSTVGFGDIVPGTEVDSQNPKEKLIATTLYVAVGLSVFAMCFKLMQEEVIEKARWLARLMAAFKRRLLAGKSMRKVSRNSKKVSTGSKVNDIPLDN